MTMLPRPRPLPLPSFAGKLFKDSDSATPASSALDGMLVEFTARWERGDAPRAEEFVGRIAPATAADVVELVYHEYCLAESSGLAPDPSSYLLRFPEHRDRLGRMFGLHEAWDDSTLGVWAAPPADLPEAGDQVGPYRLLRELGRGGFARVFLAEQEDLDHRLVVLKVSNRASAEPRLLARARHSHIVEVLRHLDAEDGSLHLVCMPFLGGATLAAVLAGRRRKGGRPRSGRDLLADLDGAADPAFPAPTLMRPAREVLAGLSHAKAVAWVVARLAEALDHADRRGVSHGDLKPANILLTADGHPMLFDFNLAVDWGQADPSGDVGGTLAYMAPERLRAIAEPGTTRSPRAADRHRADLYAMGLILRESLGGAPPATPKAGGPSPRTQAAAMLTARRREPVAGRGVPASLRPILAHCLAPDPADRYRRADELAQDLDRWRADLGTTYAPAPALWLATGRWARRRRVALVASLAAVAVGGVAAVAVGRAYDGPLRARAIANRDAAWSHVEPRVFRFRDGWQVKAEGDPVDAARHHLDRYEVLGPEDWRRRDDVRYLPEADREELEAWLLEQAWRYAAALQARNASDDDPRRALDCLERVYALSPCAVLEAGCRALRSRLRLPEPPPSPPSPAAVPYWIEQYLLGVEAESLHAALALEHYENVIRTRRGSFWAYYRAAVVASRLGDFDWEAERLGHCIRRFPKSATLRTQRAGSLMALGRHAAALDECREALALDPNFREAIRTRALIRAHLGEGADRKADLSRYESLSKGKAPGSTWPLRLELGDVPGFAPPPIDRDRALEKALAADPDDTWVRFESARRAHERGQVGEALARLDELLSAAPDNLRAQFSRAVLLLQTDRREAARAFAVLIDHPRFDELLLEQPEAVNAFNHLSRLHLEAGNFPEGLAVARRGLVQAERIEKLQGESHYRLASAYAVGAAADPALLPLAEGHLRQASAAHRNFGEKFFPQDPLFDAVRPRLAALIAAH